MLLTILCLNGIVDQVASYISHYNIFKKHVTFLQILYQINIGLRQYSRLQYRYRITSEKIVSGHPCQDVNLILRDLFGTYRGGNVLIIFLKLVHKFQMFFLFLELSDALLALLQLLLGVG